jgi:hypothetical protein
VASVTAKSSATAVTAAAQFGRRGSGIGRVWAEIAVSRIAANVFWGDQLGRIFCCRGKRQRLYATDAPFLADCGGAPSIDRYARSSSFSGAGAVSVVALASAREHSCRAFADLGLTPGHRHLTRRCES